MFDFRNATKENLKQLREQIKLCSLFTHDYKNTCTNLSADATFIFFDGYADYLDELMQENGEYIGGYNKFFDYLDKYDTEENLWAYYNILDVVALESLVEYMSETEEDELAA